MGRRAQALLERTRKVPGRKPTLQRQTGQRYVARDGGIEQLANPSLLGPGQTSYLDFGAIPDPAVGLRNVCRQRESHVVDDQGVGVLGAIEKREQ